MAHGLCFAPRAPSTGSGCVRLAVVRVFSLLVSLRSCLPGPRTRRAAVFHRLFVGPSLRVVSLPALSASYLLLSQLASVLRREACRRARANPFCACGPPTRCAVPPFFHRGKRVAPPGPRCVGPLRASAPTPPRPSRPSRPATYEASQPPAAVLRSAVGARRGRAGSQNATGKRRRALGFCTASCEGGPSRPPGSLCSPCATAPRALRLARSPCPTTHC
ncbi:hypothetical protein TRVL_09594 [Trypanosoma vivax]|nr:hypothetical protein TRVL_09594 [Trypanosoma vivax]